MLKSPSPILIFACLLLFGMGELAGAMLGRIPEQIQSLATEKARNQPEVHGLTGLEDIDRTILAKVSSEVLSRLHTFHLHGHGVGLLAFVLVIIIFNAGFHPWVKNTLIALTSLGMLYPFGWLTLMLGIPFLGAERALRLAEKTFFIPFGTSLLLAIWLAIFFKGLEVLKYYRKVTTEEGL